MTAEDSEKRKMVEPCASRKWRMICGIAPVEGHVRVVEVVDLSLYPLISP